MHTITRSGLGGLISSRDFVDLLVIEKNDEFLGTAGQSVVSLRMNGWMDEWIDGLIDQFEDE